MPLPLTLPLCLCLSVTCLLLCPCLCLHHPAPTTSHLQALKLILFVIRAAGGPSTPVPVHNQMSKFTIVVMTYEARMLTLKAGRLKTDLTQG